MPKGHPASALSRILARSDMSGECWLWLGGCYRSGYGQITDWTTGVPRKRTVHRVVWEELVGPIPPGLTLDHLCFVKICFNPDHLEVVTRGENTRRGVPRNEGLTRQRERTHCNWGHPFEGYNLIIRKNGARACRTCMNEAQRRYQQRRKELKA